MKKLILIIALVAAILPRPAAALTTNELLAVVAMPLAVAAVSEVTGVPANDLASFVTALNLGNVPPVQFVEVVRYVPVALVAENDGFVEYVRLQADQGIRGPALVTAIETRLRTFDIEPVIDLTPDRTIWVDANYIPPVVLTRVAERRAHPHGGPPGQLKKERGLQTGAEVVHGSKRGRSDDRASVRVVESRDRTVRVDREPKRKQDHGAKVDDHPRGGGAVKHDSRGRGNSGGGKGHGNDKQGGGKGNGGGNGKKG